MIKESEQRLNKLGKGRSEKKYDIKEQKGVGINKSLYVEPLICCTVNRSIC